jgi:hypothetical protein
MMVGGLALMVGAVIHMLVLHRFVDPSSPPPGIIPSIVGDGAWVLIGGVFVVTACFRHLLGKP